MGAYAKQIARNVVRPFPLAPAEYVRSARPWWRSNRVHQQFSPISDRTPWMTYGAIRHLEGAVQRGARVFEYGVGGSSVFFLDRGAKVVSVESDAAWAERVQQAFPGDWEVHVKGPDTSSTDQEHRSLRVEGDFRDYVETIDAYGEFDVIVVDGFARAGCMRRAQSHLAPGGLFVLDNSERPEYDEAASELDALGWRRDDYFGPGPFNLYFWRTTIWTKPATAEPARAAAAAASA